MLYLLVQGGMTVFAYNFMRCTGTTERVCLITGSLEAIMAVMDFIMDKIREKPDLTLKTTVDFESGKTTAERDKQVKSFVYIRICLLCMFSIPEYLYMYICQILNKYCVIEFAFVNCDLLINYFRIN